MTDLTESLVDTPVLSVKDLNVSFPSEAGLVEAVRGVSFDLHKGRTLGIVGESGSGKSVTSMAVMGLLPSYAGITGSAKLEGKEILGLSDREMSKHRGSDIAMIFQDPLSALTPVFDVGTQLVEALQQKSRISKKAAWKRAVELLDLVGIPNPDRRVKAFPHEFSGGMRQRVVIAMAIANNPKIIIADEPTTALDVTIQAQILDVIKTAQEETGAAVIMITHDMGVVASTADDVIVMYAGKPVETGPVHEIFSAPRMPYTIGLLGSIPRVDKKGDQPLIPIEGNPPVVIDLPDECPFAPRCPVAIDECRAAEPTLRPVERMVGDSDALHAAACIRADEIRDRMIDGKELYPVPEMPEDTLRDVPRSEREMRLEVEDLHKVFPLMKGSLLKRRVGDVYAVSGLDFDLRAGETLAIVGESGCGKSTTLLEIMDLGESATQGTIKLAGKDVSQLNRRERRQMRRDVQMVFQDPMGALDPRLTVKEIIAEPLTAFGTDENVTDRVDELMQLVGLDPTQMDRFPGNFSGGQRQRIGLARALATNPKVIVLDEPVSALDVSIQAGMINLLDELKLKLGLSYLFVAHDLSVIRHISDRVAVMYLGKFVEYGDTDTIFENPRHPYTQALLSAIPVPDPDVEKNRERILLEGDLPSPTDKKPGCAFRTRCPLYATLDEGKRSRCDTETPVMRHDVEQDHEVACHYR
ncbi:MAG: ABC transporter ATP-binding protein [Flaviflexus sp.]|nr:ABC transporter ATP-binding protein [Flaviflexus sp.]